jgi:glyoxalase family protein
VEIDLAIPAGSHDYWRDRLTEHGAKITGTETRRGERAIVFEDPHAQHLALVETHDDREFTPWAQSPVASDRQIIGLHTVRLWERDVKPTGDFLRDVLGFEHAGEEGGWHRFAVGGGGSGKFLEACELPNGTRGMWGVGTMHHVAWRVHDEEVELRVRERVAQANRRPTEVIDRFWFKSVYFLEPGGVLFEIATDGPGFTVDEDLATLGEHLVLPPWLEPHRREIEDALPPLAVRV